MSSVRRRFAVLGTAACFSLHVAGARADSTITSTYESRFGQTTIHVRSSARDDRIKVDGERGSSGLIITDPRGVAVDSVVCERLNATTAACESDRNTAVDVSTISGDDSIFFGSHVDLYSVYAGGGTGDDTLTVRAPATAGYFAGGDGNDILRGGSESDSLYGGGGNDVLIGRSGADVLLGGNGADKLFGGTSRDTFDAGGGADRLRAGDALRDDEIDCGTGRDQLIRDDVDPRGSDCELRSLARN